MATNQDIEISGIVLNIKNVKKIKLLFRKLAHMPKLRILKKISEAPKEGICVNEIFTAKGINLGQSHASIILSELRKDNLVTSRKDGKNRYYTLNKKNLQVAKAICDLADKLT